jgi:hypothetical protein
VDSFTNSSEAKDAYRGIEDGFQKHARVIHVHIKSNPVQHVTERMALNLLHVAVGCRKVEYQRWFVFDKPDILAIQKQIIRCMSEMEMST